MVIKWCSSFGIYDTEDEITSIQYSLSPDHQFCILQMYKILLAVEQ